MRPRAQFFPAGATALLGVLLLLLAAPLARAHPVHTSHADLEFNPATRRVEIALRVIADDLLAALNTGDAPRLSYEQTPPATLDARLHAYVRRHFRLVNPAGEPAPLIWIGREFDSEGPHQRLWLYFEAPLPAGFDGARLLHGLLLEHLSRQENTARLRHGPRETTLAFVAGDDPKPITLPR